MPDIEFPTSAGPTPGYFAPPACGAGPATIVLHEWWGLDEHIRSVCDRLAAAGFFALAPDLRHGDGAARPSEAEEKTMALAMGSAVPQIDEAVRYLTCRRGVLGRGVGALGFCLGAGLALWAAATCPQITAAVTYYYVPPNGRPDFAAIKGPVLGHFGTADVFITLKEAKALEVELRAAGVDAKFEKYTAAGHAFFNPTDRLGTYDPDAAQRSWERTVSFLGGVLASRGQNAAPPR